MKRLGKLKRSYQCVPLIEVIRPLQDSRIGIGEQLIDIPALQELWVTRLKLRLGKLEGSGLQLIHVVGRHKSPDLIQFVFRSIVEGCAKAGRIRFFVNVVAF